MEQFVGIPGTISEAARRIRWKRLPDHDGARAYCANVEDGGLVALVSHDRAGVGGKPLWHVSVSHRDHNDQPDRVPDWDELKHAVYTLCKDVNVCWILVFPRPGQPYVDHHPTTLHLWESEKEIDS